MLELVESETVHGNSDLLESIIMDIYMCVCVCVCEYTAPKRAWCTVLSSAANFDLSILSRARFNAQGRSKLRPPLML